MTQSLARAGSLLLALSIGALLVGRAAGCTTDAAPAPPGAPPVSAAAAAATGPAAPPASRDAGPTSEDAGPPAAALDANAPDFFPATKAAAPIFEHRPIAPASEPAPQAPQQQAPR